MYSSDVSALSSSVRRTYGNSGYTEETTGVKGEEEGRLYWTCALTDTNKMSANSSSKAGCIGAPCVSSMSTCGCRSGGSGPGCGASQVLVTRQKPTLGKSEAELLGVALVLEWTSNTRPDTDVQKCIHSNLASQCWQLYLHIWGRMCTKMCKHRFIACNLMHTWTSTPLASTKTQSIKRRHGIIINKLCLLY